MTFREPEAARRACADPTPIIDGRRANCNLASLGRPRPQVLYGIISIVFSWSIWQFYYLLHHDYFSDTRRTSETSCPIQWQYSSHTWTLHWKFWLPATTSLQLPTGNGVSFLWVSFKFDYKLKFVE